MVFCSGHSSKYPASKITLVILILGWVCSGIGLAQAPDTLFISTSQVVHLRFASELKYVNLGSRDIVAYREHPSRLEIDTRSAQSLPSFSTSNADGGPSASFNFEEISNMKQELYHIGTRGYGIDILCENIFVKDDVLFLLISLKNGSAVSYELSAPRFAVESKRRTKRGLQYEKAIFPKQSYGLGVVQPEDVGKLVFTFDKIALTRGQVFRVYFYEKEGARNFVLTLSAWDVNGARRLN